MSERDFLSRWSERKLTRPERQDPAPADPNPGAEPNPVADPTAPPEKTDAEILAEHGLPDPETLAPGDDIRGFMAKTVPARLRNRALRMLWRGNPVLANLDELLDYGEDFTDKAKVVENLATAWAVGRGYARPEPEPEPEPQSEPPTELERDPDALASETRAGPDAEPDHGPDPGAHAQSDEPSPPTETAAAEPTEVGPALRRRMRFTFPDGD